jgi:hypothetical protein
LTLIFSNVDDIAGLLAGSDILLSTPAKSGPQPFTLPFREQPLVHESQGWTFGRFAQKLVTFGRTLVQWAGREVIARAAIAEIQKASDSGEKQISLHTVLGQSELSESELSAVGIIYHYIPGPETIFRDQHNCTTFIQGETESLIADGKGSDHFFRDMVVSGGDRLTHLAFTAGLIAKVVAHSVYEWSGDTISLDHLYGGWFELASKAADHFHKIPYAIKFWRRSDEILESGGPIFFGFYDESRLAVLGLQPREIGDRVTFEQRLQIVPDLFGRGHRSGPPKETVRPEFVAHVVFEKQGDLHFTHIEPYDAFNDGMVLEVGPSGFHVAYPIGLRQRLLNQRSLEADFSLFNRSIRPPS